MQKPPIPTRLVVAPRGHSWHGQKLQKDNEWKIVREPAADMLTEKKEIWIVLDEDGQPIYCAGWPEACHEHINEAINEHDIDGAAKWKVRRAELVPNAPDQPGRTG